MKVFTMASYVVVAIVIYSVLVKVAERTGKRNGKVETAILALALIWPLWEEFAVLAILAYVFYKLSQKRNATEPRSTPSFTAQNYY